MMNPNNWDPLIRRSILICCSVVLLGTAGYTWIEGWTPWQSLFFTLVTLTTVGYGDYGLTQEGERFTAILMIGGIGSVSYAVSQCIQYATTKALHPEKRMLNLAKKLTNHAIICGYGRTGSRVAERLLQEHVEFVIIDSNMENVERARQDGYIAILGDATTDKSLHEAGIVHAQSVAAVTSSDSANAMICLSVKALKPAAQITARVEDEISIQKLVRAGADSVINPSSYGGDGIAESLVRPDVAELLYGLNHESSGSLQFAEVKIRKNTTEHQKTIAEIGIKHPKLVFVAARSGMDKVKLRPSSDLKLSEGDVLIVAGTHADIEKLSIQKSKRAG
ncbi:MAG: TrkA family potassium uptake protein [Phycisphaerales bacterium]